MNGIYMYVQKVNPQKDLLCEQIVRKHCHGKTVQKCQVGRLQPRWPLNYLSMALRFFRFVHNQHAVDRLQEKYEYDHNHLLL